MKRAVRRIVLGGALACAASLRGTPPPDSAVLQHPWGVYAWGPASENPPKDIPIRGVPLSWRWAEIEPERGHFEFDREVRAPLERARTNGQFTHIMLWVAPSTPEWLYDAGVPRVIVPERISPARKRQQPTYPYYFDARYQNILHATVRALADYIAGLPSELKSRIVFIQVAEGATGDGQPYKGVPVDAKFRISPDAWNDYRHKTWEYYQSVFQRADGSLSIPILVNGDANGPAENTWLLGHCDVFGVKQGMFSHGYLVSDTVQRLARWEKFRSEALAQGKTIFSRGEEDEEWKVCGWCSANPPQALYWTALFALHCKLDVWNVPTDALNSQPLGETVRLFNRYAGYDEPAGSPGAFCALRRGLDASDTAAFPENKFGRADRQNRDRYLAIARAYAPLGARQGDPDKALGGGMRNRQADDQNDVGWGIWPGNFERHLTQLQPEETSVALWHVAPEKHPYSLFARRFDAAAGKKEMRFRIAPGFFSDPALPAAARLRVAYLDRGAGRWSVVYATAQGERTARMIEPANSGQWRDITVDLPDAVWHGALEGGADVVLRYISGGDTVFHLLEVERL